MQDLSSNELSYLPNSMGEMISLKDLNLRRNRLEVLPDGEDKYHTYRCLFCGESLAPRVNLFCGHCSA